MVTYDNLAIGKAREKIFCSLIMKEGEIKRGSLVSKMNISSATFSHEYTDYLEAYPNIKYNKKDRLFTYEP